MQRIYARCEQESSRRRRSSVFDSSIYAIYGQQLGGGVFATKRAGKTNNKITLRVKLVRWQWFQTETGT
jgi:hypothetical protein